jgi:hypothetical protein
MLTEKLQGKSNNLFRHLFKTYVFPVPSIIEPNHQKSTETQM